MLVSVRACVSVLSVLCVCRGVCVWCVGVCGVWCMC